MIYLFLIGETNHKLVAAKASRDTAFAKAFLDRVGNILYYFVPHIVTVSVVDKLEVVHVNKENGIPFVYPLQIKQLLELLEECAPVVKLG